MLNPEETVSPDRRTYSEDHPDIRRCQLKHVASLPLILSKYLSFVSLCSDEINVLIYFWDM